MKKKNIFGKIIRWTILILLLLIGFIVASPFLFKGKIVEVVKEEANKNLKAKVDFGDFDLTVFSSFPNLTLTINDISVANAEPFAGDTLFSVKTLSATINLMSVLSGDQYEIRQILLDHPRIKATVLKDGTASYDIAIAGPDTGIVAVQDTGAPARFKMSLKSLEIVNAWIRYDDASLNTTAALDSFNYKLSGDFTQDNFVMENDISIAALSCNYEGIPYLNKVRMVVKAALGADMTAGKFTFKENELALNELGFGMDGWFSMPENGYDMDLSFKCKQSEFRSFLSLIPAVYSKDFASVKTSGALAFSGFAKGMYTENKLPAFGLDLKIDNAMFQYPSLPKAVNNIFVDLKVDNKTGDPDATVTDLRKFHMEMAGNPLDMTMHVEHPVSDPGINGQLLGKLDLSTIKDVIPLDKGDELNGLIDADVKLAGRYSSIEQEKYEDFEAKGSVKVSNMNYSTTGMPSMKINTMTMNFSPKFVALEGFDAVMGVSDYKADGRIENFMQYFFKDSLLKGTFSLRSSLIDLNEFMAADSTAPAPTTADTSSLSVIEVPGNIDFVLNSTIGKLVYDDINMNNVKGAVVIRDSKVLLNDLMMNLLGGSMKMNGTYSTLNPRDPQVDFRLNIKDFDIPETYKYFNTVQKLAPIAKYTQGKFSTDVTYTSSLDQAMMPIWNTMKGEGVLKTSKVLVSGFEPLNKLADALGGFDKFKKADFSDMTIKYAFSEGKVSYDKFPFKSGSVNGEVEGSTGFDQAINYKMGFEVPTKDMPPGAQQLVGNMLTKANMLGVGAKLPEKVKLNALFGGTVTQPTVKTDVKDIAGNVVEDVKEMVKDTVKALVKDKIEDVKKDLTAEKEKIMKDAEKLAQQVKDESAKTAEQVRKEGYAKADELEKAAKNPIEKLAAKKAAEKMRKETDEKANKIITDGNAKADKIMTDAKAKADALK
ncbi:MAG: AsmA family protein [Bacteroidia bacterium]|nr:AsmA family protein [Bacteroidia bacterium]